MFRHELICRGVGAVLLVSLAAPAAAQSFRVQCPQATITHPTAANTSSVQPYTGPTYVPVPTTGSGGVFAQDYTTGATGPVNGAIKCQQISGGDGYATMGDGTQTYMFSFGPLSGLADIAAGHPGTEFPTTFNTVATDVLGTAPAPGDPATTVDAQGTFSYNGAIGLSREIVDTFSVYDISEAVHANCTATVTVILNVPSPFKVGDQVVIAGQDLAGYTGTVTVTKVNVPIAASFLPLSAANAFQYALPANAGPPACSPALAEVIASSNATASYPWALDGHVDPRQIIDVGVMNGNIPGPLMAIDEDDEFFLTLSNVGMIMRPDLFEQHTVHFHGYPNASPFYDGVPDASVAIQIGGSFTYYYLAPDAGTYFWHCHITPPEHLQMGMVGQMYVRPRQNHWTGDLYSGLQQQQKDLRTACNTAADVLCSNPLPAVKTGATNNGAKKYAYNDGDGSTYYDVEYPLQMHGFDPNFHFVGMTFNPEGFTDMKDKYFLLNGRSYPDTVSSGPMQTQSSDGNNHFSQPLPAIISITAGQRALLRISNLSVTEYHTLASLGIPMKVVALNAKLLRDQAGTNLAYNTNSITIGGGESLDVILDTCSVRSVANDPSSSCTAPMSAGTYFLYTPNLDHLANDAENFGGLMTEIYVN